MDTYLTIGYGAEGQSSQIGYRGMQEQVTSKKFGILGITYKKDKKDIGYWMRNLASTFHD